MMRFFKLRKWYHVTRARGAVNAQMRIADEYDCGRHMLLIISPSFRHADKVAEKHLDWLRDHDPECPEYRGSLAG